MGEGDLQSVGGLLNLRRLHCCFGDVLFFVVCGGRTAILTHRQGPVSARRDRVQRVRANWHGGGSKRELRFGKQRHGGAAGNQRLAGLNSLFVSWHRRIPYRALATVSPLASS